MRAISPRLHIPSDFFRHPWPDEKREMRETNCDTQSEDENVTAIRENCGWCGQAQRNM
jgi:hypothetical protein